MVHPHPTDEMREAFFAWLIGKPYTPEALPRAVRTFEQYKVDTSVGIPPVPFKMLTALNLTQKRSGHRSPCSPAGIWPA